MIEFILVFALITFGAIIGSMLISLRKLEIENKKFRRENNFIGKKVF
jgi:hypothetical protein